MSSVGNFGNFGGTQDFSLSWSPQTLLNNTSGQTFLNFNTPNVQSSDILDQYITPFTSTNTGSQTPTLIDTSSSSLLSGSAIFKAIYDFCLSFLQKNGSNSSPSSDPNDIFDFSQYATPSNTFDLSQYANLGTTFDWSQFGDPSTFTTATNGSNGQPPVVQTPSAKTNDPSGVPVTTSQGSHDVDTGDFSTEPQQGALSPEQTQQQADKLVQHLMKDYGFTKAQASGIVGNLMHESAGLNANMNQEYGFEGRGGPGGPSSDMNQGYGWAQWSYGRKQEYLQFCSDKGLNPASPAANYAFLKHELDTTESGTVAAVKATNTPQEAAVAFRKVYERAEQPFDQSRVDAANQVAAWVA